MQQVYQQQLLHQQQQYQQLQAMQAAQKAGTTEAPPTNGQVPTQTQQAPPTNSQVLPTNPQAPLMANGPTALPTETTDGVADETKEVNDGMFFLVIVSSINKLIFSHAELAAQKVDTLFT